MKRVLIVTGEASGDLHGANLIRAAGRLTPQLRFFGAGGPRMAEAGCEILVPGEEIAVMGLVEVLGHLPVIRRAFKRLSAILENPAERPAALVLIDFPDFNLRLARVAKRAGVPVLYYVSPQVWAWRQGRVKKIAAVVDSLAAILPFEPEFYRGLPIRVEYVGHPLLDEFRIDRERDAFLAGIGIDGGRPVVGLFPGSRRSELHYNLGVMLDAAALVQRRQPDVAFLLPVAPTLERSAIEAQLLQRQLPVTLVDGNIYDVANACHAVLAVSGTVTLQIALAGAPMAIVYRMSPLTYAIGKRLVKVPYIGLANIVAGEGVVREFIQERATADNLAGEILHILHDPGYAAQLRQGLSKVRGLLGTPGCSGRVAAMLAALIEEQGHA
ncbi:MAG: lipid-A-disaccharide synthase [Deltaproteobacteria bacterium]|nr:MAG: lipid-A-disaccharide synthase [Deltaproteobacteria bacterium]